MDFHEEALLAPRPTPKLEDHPLSAVRDCLFNLFAAALHIGGRSSIRNPRTRHAVVTGTHLSHVQNTLRVKCKRNINEKETNFFFSGIYVYVLMYARMYVRMYICT